jgi:hypothetical protein
MLLPVLAALQILPTNEQLAAQVDPKRLQLTVERLAAFPNRNTNNPTLTQAAEYLAGELRKIPGLQVELMHYTAPRGQRVPMEKDVVQVVATLAGKTDRRVLVGGHFDTINMADRANLDAKAPGANDDASGTALTLELARVLSQRKWNNTLVFACFSGEEQGLLGSTALARRAKSEGWRLEAVLSNDIVGSGESLNGQRDKRHVRVFSEEVPEHNGRELARFVEWASRGKVRGFEPRLVLRRDRFMRGGDHTSFNREGITAVRFTESFEEFSRQHSENDLPKFVDFRYLANVARVNLLTMASLADAAEAPTDVRYDRAQAHDTTLTWTAKPGVKYTVFWRPTNTVTWTAWREVGAVGKAVIQKVNKDDHEFAVSATGGIPIPAK